MTQIIDANSMGMREANQEIRIMSREEEVTVSNASHISGLGSGMNSGYVLVKGDAGDYMAMLNSGARFNIQGDCGRFLGDGMTSGEILVHGSVGEGAGEYCYGGRIVVEGDAGDFLATMNKGGSIVIEGDVGNDVATYMLSGELIIMGNAGERLANFLIGGRVYIMGDIASIGSNAHLDRLGSEDIDLLAGVIEETDVDAVPRQFRKFVPRSSKPFYGKKVEPKGVK